jgi:hypothetical protein
MKRVAAGIAALALAAGIPATANAQRTLTIELPPELAGIVCPIVKTNTSLNVVLAAANLRVCRDLTF